MRTKVKLLRRNRERSRPRLRATAVTTGSGDGSAFGQNGLSSRKKMFAVTDPTP